MPVKENQATLETNAESNIGFLNDQFSLNQE
jgi:hypothetical protein